MKPLKDLPYIKIVRSRGNVYYYFDTGRDVKGKRIFKRLPDKSDPKFGGSYAAYYGARHRRESVAELPTIKSVSRQYQLSPKFKDRSESTQNTYLTYLKVLEEEMGDAPINDVKRTDIRVMLDKMQDRRGAANMVALVVRNIMAYAMERDYIAINPTEGIALFPKGKDGHEPWPEDLVTKALADPEVRLPVALLYYTAQRIGDVCKMRWNDVRDGYIEVVQEKTSKELDIRLHDDLRAILDATPKAAMTILYGKKLRPMRTATLRLQLQRWAANHGHDIVPHGLRKNAVNALLEAGCSTAETSAISGQSLEMVERYAKRRNNRKLGSAAILKWQGNGS